MNDFIKKYYLDSVKLKERFKNIEKNDWNTLTVLNELLVQIAHVYSIINASIFDEKYRNINNIGDEISDVFLQLFATIYYGKYDIKKIEYNTDSASLEEFIVCFGQCSEAIMEEKDYRFRKKRIGFNSIIEYIHYKLSNMFSIIYNVANANKIDLYNEYKLMLKDASNFLNNYEQIKNNL